jgi:hypothetical protein
MSILAPASSLPRRSTLPMDTPKQTLSGTPQPSEAHPTLYQTGLEVAQPGLEKVENPEPSVRAYWANNEDPAGIYYTQHATYPGVAPIEEKRHRGLICGLEPKIFWVAFILMLLILAGGLGGGLGAGLSARNNNLKEDSNSGYVLVLQYSFMGNILI